MALRVPWSETWVGLDIARDREATRTHVDVHTILDLLERRLDLAMRIVSMRGLGEVRCHQAPFF
jgi:hypothetical protein